MNNLGVCEHCYKDIDLENAITVYNTSDLEVTLCEECGTNNDNFFYCQYHERLEFFEDRHEEIYEVKNYGEICVDTYESSFDFAMCEICGDLFCGDDVTFNDNDEMYYCESCYEENFSSLIESYHNHTDEYEYEKRYAKDEDKENRNILTFGVEVEVSGGSVDTKVKHLVEEIHDNTSLFIFEHDGSLPYNSVEIISYPFSMEYINKHNYIMKDLYNTINYYQFNCEDERCGYHIHVGRNRNINTVENYIVLLVEYFKDEFAILSKRDRNRLDRWSRFITVDNKEELENDLTTIKEIINRGFNRYHAINVDNRDTIEFRMFSGSNNYEENMARIEMVNNLCKWTIDHCELMSVIYDDEMTKLLKHLSLFEILTYDSNEYVEEYLIDNFGDIFGFTCA